MYPAAPSLDTARLTLRGHRLEDFPELVAMRADPAVTRYIGGRPCSEEETWTRLLRNAGHWSLLGYGYWAIRERATGRYVGDVGFGNLRRALEPALGDTPEAGWVLASWAHGRGFATEAVRAIHEWGDAHLGGARTACVIAAENTAAIRVAIKAGYHEWARSTYKDMPVTLFER